MKDAVMAVGGKGMLLFARSQPDTDGKLATHAISYEHLELAAYELLSRVASRAGDEETASVARSIRDEEQAMADRLEASFDGLRNAFEAAVALRKSGLQFVVAPIPSREGESLLRLDSRYAIALFGRTDKDYAGHYEEQPRIGKCRLLVGDGEEEEK